MTYAPAVEAPGCERSQPTAGSPGPRCAVWIQPRRDCYAGLLTPSERLRWSAFRFSADRDRFATATWLQRRALREVTGDVTADIRRSCRGCGADDHGPVSPAAPYADRWSVSATHSADLVAVAVTPGTAPVGIDAEPRRALRPALAAHVCTSREARDDLGGPDAGLALLTRWVRKEALLKAARVGLDVPMRHLVVSGNAVPPRLLDWDARTRPAAVVEGAVRCHDVDVVQDGAAYQVSLAVLTRSDVVVERWD